MHWQKALPEDVAKIPEDMRTLFALKSMDGSELAYGVAANIDRGALKKEGGASGWIDAVIEGSVSSGLSVKKETSFTLGDGEIRHVLYNSPPRQMASSKNFQSFFEVIDNKFIAIGILGTKVFEHTDLEIQELLKLAHLHKGRN